MPMINITGQELPNYNEAKATYDQLRANGTQGFQKHKQMKCTL